MWYVHNIYDISIIIYIIGYGDDANYCDRLSFTNTNIMRH